MEKKQITLADILPRMTQKKSVLLIFNGVI